MRTATKRLAVAILGLTLATPFAAQRVLVRPLPDSLVERWVTPRLADSERVEPPAFIGSLGPAGNSILVISSEGLHYGGFVLIDSAGGWRKIPLPLLADWAGETVEGVMVEKGPAGSEPLIIVIATYITGIGRHGGEEFYLTAAIQWNGSAFVHRCDLEVRIGKLETAAAIRRELRRI